MCNGSTPTKLTNVRVSSVACSANGSAFVTEKGELYLFGMMSGDFTDSQSGEVIVCTKY